MKITNLDGMVLWEDSSATIRESIEAAVAAGANLAGARLGGCDLTGADLEGASLRGASLEEAIQVDRGPHPETREVEARAK